MAEETQTTKGFTLGALPLHGFGASQEAVPFDTDAAAAARKVTESQIALTEAQEAAKKASETLPPPVEEVK